MDYLPGVHLDRFLASEPAQAERNRYGTLIVRSSMRFFYKARLVYSDINPGNYIFMSEGRLGLIDFGCCRLFSDEEWDVCRQNHRAVRLGVEALKIAIRRSFTGSETGAISEEAMAVAQELNDWSQEPIRAIGPFDFGDDTYFKRGVEILARLQTVGLYRNEPINLWLARTFLSFRALLNRLGAKVDMHSEMDVESPADMWV
jgi:hypothetical protein